MKVNPDRNSKIYTPETTRAPEGSSRQTTLTSVRHERTSSPTKRTTRQKRAGCTKGLGASTVADLASKPSLKLTKTCQNARIQPRLLIRWQDATHSSPAAPGPVEPGATGAEASRLPTMPCMAGTSMTFLPDGDRTWPHSPLPLAAAEPP